MCTVEMKAFGQRLRRFLRRAEAYAILDAHVGGTWMAGGCWLLAEALAPLVQRPLVAVWSFAGAGIVQQHVVLQLAEDCFLDADGAQSATALLRKMVRVERLDQPYLDRFDPHAATGMSCPTRGVHQLQQALRRTLMA